MRVLTRVDISGLVKQLATLEKAVSKRVCRVAATKGGQAYVKDAKANCPQRDTKQALKSAGVVAKGGGSGQASYIGQDKKGKTVKVSYRGGLLRKALGYKVKSYHNSGRSIFVAICGVRNGFAKQIGVRQNDGQRRQEFLERKEGGKTRIIKNTRRSAKAGEAIWADPQKYAHLVIGGTKHSKPHPFHENATKYAALVTLHTASVEMDKAIAEAARAA